MVSRTTSLLCIFLIVIVSWQCIEPPAQPVIPTWDTDLSLPLINRLYSLQELVDKNPDILSTEADGTILYTFSDTLRYDPIGELIRMASESSPFSFDLGLFTITPGNIDHTIVLNNHLPVFGRNGARAADPVTIAGTFPRIESMEYLIAETGTLVLEIENQTGTPIEIVNGIEISNTDDNNTVALFIYPAPIQDGERVSGESSLDDVRIYKDLAYEFTLAGIDNGNGEFNENPVLEFTLSFDNLQVREANAIIPSQKLTGGYDGEIVFDDSLYFREVSFSEGFLRFVVQHDIDLTFPVIVTLPELRHRNNTSIQFSAERIVGPGDTGEIIIDLTDWIIQTEGGELKNSLEYFVQLGTIGQTMDFRTLHAEDQITGEVGTSDPPDHWIIVHGFDGRIPPTRFLFNEHAELDLGDVIDHFEGEVSFEDASLLLDIFLGGGYDADADLQVVGKNKFGHVDSIAIPADQRRITAGEWSTIILDKDNSTINEFLGTFVPTLPEDLFVDGDLILNPDYLDGYFSIDGELNSLLHLNVPFDMGIRNGIIRDTLTIGGSGDDIDRDMVDLINYGMIYFESVNRIPLGIDVRMNLLDRDGTVLRQIPAHGAPPIGVGPAPVDESRMSADTVYSDMQVLELTGDDISAIIDADRAELVLYIHTTEDVENVIFRSSDTFAIRIYASFNIRADFN